MDADERSSAAAEPLEDIWGDGRATNSTPIPEDWDHHRGTEDTEYAQRLMKNAKVESLLATRLK